MKSSETPRVSSSAEATSFGSVLFHFLLGGLALVVSSLTGSLLIGFAHSIAFIYHLGPPDPETQALLTKVILFTNRQGWLLMWIGTCLTAAFSFARERAPSRILLLPLTFGAWLAALPFTLELPEMRAFVPQVIRAIPLFLVALLGSALGLAYRRKINEKLEAIFRLRHAASPEELVLQMSRMLGRGDPRVLLLSFEQPNEQTLSVEADSKGEISQGTALPASEGLMDLLQGRSRGGRLRHGLEMNIAPTTPAFFYRLSLDESGDRVLMVAPSKGRWLYRPASHERLIEHAEASLRQQALVGLAREQERAKERKQMSYELHDTLTQDLVSGLLQLDAVRSKFKGGEGQALESLNAIERTLRDSLRVSREMAFKYHGDSAVPKDLRADLELVVDEFRGTEKITVQFEPVGDDVSTTSERKACLKAALREALSNVKKHSRATFVRVTFSQMGRECALDVRDDGRGMSESPLAPLVGRGGFGLPALRQRVEALGGRMSVESAPLLGTTLSVQFPASVESAE